MEILNPNCRFLHESYYHAVTQHSHCLQTTAEKVISQQPVYDGRYPEHLDLLSSAYDRRLTNNNALLPGVSTAKYNSNIEDQSYRSLLKVIYLFIDIIPFSASRRIRLRRYLGIANIVKEDDCLFRVRSATGTTFMPDHDDQGRSVEIASAECLYLLMCVNRANVRRS